MKIIFNAPADRWEEYRDLRIEALENVPQAFLDDPIGARSFSGEEWQQKMENMYFAETDGKWVGMIGAYTDKKQKLRHILNVVGFYVSPDFRGKGVGRELLEKVIVNAREKGGIKKIQLGVVTTQEPAYGLYESVGFENIGMLKYAVRVGDEYFDEYLMELYLD